MENKDFKKAWDESDPAKKGRKVVICAEEIKTCTIPLINTENSLTEKFKPIEEEKKQLEVQINKMLADFQNKYKVDFSIKVTTRMPSQISFYMLVDLAKH